MKATAAKTIEPYAVHAIRHAPGDKGQAIVLLNSMDASTDAWGPVLALRLRKPGCGTLSFDHRGQGRRNIAEE